MVAVDTLRLVVPKLGTIIALAANIHSSMAVDLCWAIPEGSLCCRRCRAQLGERANAG